MIARIKTLLKQIKIKRRVKRDNKRLTLARDLIRKVCKNELPGNIIEVEGEKFIIDDVVMSISKNRLSVRKSKLNTALLRKDPRALAYYRELSEKEHTK